MQTEEPNIRPVRRIHRDKDLLQVMEMLRADLGITMEELSERAGVPERYYNKVKMGLVSEKRRKLRRKMLGRKTPLASTVRRPFAMKESASWLLEALGYTLVVMPLDQALEIVDPDPVTDMQRRMLERGAA